MSEVLNKFTKLDRGMIDITEISKNTGIKLPVVLSERLWREMVVTDAKSRMYGQKEEKRVLSLCETLRMELIKGKSKNLSFLFLTCLDPKTIDCRTLKADYTEGKRGPYVMVSLEDEKIN